MKKTRIQYFGLTGPVSLASYTAAVVFSPLAYPGYNWMAQAVSDLSAESAPSLALWNRLSFLYNICGLLCLTLVCIYIEGRLTRLLRAGIYTFTGMNWISSIGYSLFPLTESGFVGTFQDVMHIVITAAVVLLSILSLLLIFIGGLRDKRWRSLGIWAAIALGMMFVGAIGMNLVPATCFGIVERFSVFSAVGYVAVLGISLFRGFPQDAAAQTAA